MDDAIDESVADELAPIVTQLKERTDEKDDLLDTQVISTFNVLVTTLSMNLPVKLTDCDGYSGCTLRNRARLRQVAPKNWGTPARPKYSHDTLSSRPSYSGHSITVGRPLPGRPDWATWSFFSTETPL